MNIDEKRLAVDPDYWPPKATHYLPGGKVFAIPAGDGFDMCRPVEGGEGKLHGPVANVLALTNDAIKKPERKGIACAEHGFFSHEDNWAGVRCPRCVIAYWSSRVDLSRLHRHG